MRVGIVTDQNQPWQTVVERWHDGTLRVVLHGSMKPRLLPVGHHVAMDGFYKHLDGSVTPMSDKEFNEF